MVHLIPETEVIGILARLHQMYILGLRIVWSEALTLDARLYLLEKANTGLKEEALYALRQHGPTVYLRFQSLVEAHQLIRSLEEGLADHSAVLFLHLVDANGSSLSTRSKDG